MQVCSGFIWLIGKRKFEIKSPNATEHFSFLCLGHIKTWISSCGNSRASAVCSSHPPKSLHGLIFIGPCIVICSYSTTNKTHLLSQIIYSCKMLYMFWTVFLSIIRSSISSLIAAAVWHMLLVYTQFWSPDDGWKDRLKHVERFTRINNLR
jgi:hypothetical protein